MEEEWDWGDLSAEDLDSLERDALEKIRAQRQHTTTFTPPLLPINNDNDNDNKEGKPPSVPGAGALPAPPSPKPVTLSDETSKGLPKVSVKFFLHSTGRIAARCQYDQVLISAIRNIPRATWNAKERLWIFPLSSLSSAERILRDVPGLIVEVENLDPLVERAIAAACAAPDCQDWYQKMPHCIESKLLPFQRDGVRFILQHGCRALLADEMGLGKTIQAIAVATCVRDSWPVLILAPSFLRLQWASMIQQWLNIPPSDILVVLSQWSGSNRSGFNIVSSSSKGNIQLDGLFNIISYDAVAKLQNLLVGYDFKVVIADESHFLKNAQAKRTVASLPVIKKAKYAILLSGTPALSRPIELFKQLEALYPDVYKCVHEYGNRYCKGGIFGVYQGASNHDELHNLIKATVMIRRLKKDVLSELPLKSRQQVFLELADKDMKQLNALFRELEVVKSIIKACSSEKEVESLKFNEQHLINKIFTASAEAKIPAVLDYLETVIEAGCKFLIFAHHQPMIDSIYEFLLKKKVGCIRIDGGTPPASRQAFVTDFQEKDSIKAAVLSIKAGGAGLTLTAASTVIFAELSWTPGDLIQAEDRVHRIGQVSAVNIYYLLANDTVDDIIWDVVQSKLENLGQMLDGHENTLEVAGSRHFSSPAKQKTIDSYMKSSPAKQKTIDSYMKSSPAKQKTLDSYMKSSPAKHNTTGSCIKRLSTADDLECQPNAKYPRN